MKRDYLPTSELILNRPRVNNIFHKVFEYPLIAAVAGPGYGKTISAAEFCKKAECKLVWMHFLPMDNELNSFWAQLIDALAHELPCLSEILQKTSFPNTPQAFHSLIKKISKELPHHTKILLVLDNVENIENDGIYQFLNHLIHAEVKDIHFLLMSNTRSSITKCTGNTIYDQIGANELRFNQKEIQELFQCYNQKLSEADLNFLSLQTEGWPLALHLFAMQSDASSQHYVSYKQTLTDLFNQNYYSAYPEEIQRLLVKLSFFQHIPLGLILAIDMPGNVLRILLNHIFISYDYEKERFHFHNLYRHFLLKLHPSLDQNESIDLYSAAGLWYWENHFYSESLECFWFIRDYDQFLNIILALPKETLNKELADWILDKLNIMKTQAYHNHEKFLLCFSMMYLEVGKIREGKKLLLPLIHHMENHKLTEETKSLLGNGYIAMIDIAFTQNELNFKDYTQKALSLHADGIHILPGRFLSPMNRDTFFLAGNTTVNVEETLSCLFDFFESAQQLYINIGHAYPYLFAAEAFYYTKDFESSTDYCIKAIYSAKESNQHDIVANALCLQMRMTLFQGDFFQAKSFLSELIEYIDQNDPKGLAGLKDWGKGLFYLSLNDHSQIPECFYHAAAPSDDLPFGIGRTKLLSALLQYTTGNFDVAYAMLLELEEIFTEQNLWCIQVSAGILKAACLLKMKNINKALHSLWHAYNMTWQNNITICFAEFGTIMLSLLDAASSQSDFKFDSQWLNHVKKSTEEHIKKKSIMSKLYGNNYKKNDIRIIDLTPREQEVLFYLTQGLTRDDIGVVLGISLHGVKKHITNIYNKLGAANRADAVQIALSNGLVTTT